MRIIFKCLILIVFLCVATSSRANNALAQEQAPSSSAATPTSKGKPWWERRHRALCQQKGRQEAQLVFLGDSITDQWSQAGAAVWKERYAPYKALNLGIGGDSTQHLLWRLEQGALDGLSPKVVVVLIGTNNAWTHDAAQIAEGVTAVTRQVRQRLPQARVLLLGIFPRGQRRDDPMRALVDDATARLKAANRDPNVTFLDLGAALSDADGLPLEAAFMPDRLHLSPEGYRRWADAMDPTLTPLLKP